MIALSTSYLFSAPRTNPLLQHFLTNARTTRSFLKKFIPFFGSFFSAQHTFGRLCRPPKKESVTSSSVNASKIITFSLTNDVLVLHVHVTEYIKNPKVLLD